MPGRLPPRVPEERQDGQRQCIDPASETGKKPQAEWKYREHGWESCSFASPQHLNLFPSISQPRARAGGPVLHVPIRLMVTFLSERHRSRGAA